MRGKKTKTQTEKTLGKLSKRTMARRRDLVSGSVGGSAVRQLLASEQIERVGRGLYRAKDAEITENHSLVQAALLIPQGTVCLLSALRFHSLTTQAPFEVWMAIDNHAWRPTVADVPLRIHYFSGRALTEGVEQHRIEGINVNIYGAAKTVADCFKFRNKVGIDVALEALRDYLHTLRLPEKDLWHYAEVCRVKNVMRPYLEALQ